MIPNTNANAHNKVESCIMVVPLPILLGIQPHKPRHRVVPTPAPPAASAPSAPNHARDHELSEANVQPYRSRPVQLPRHAAPDNPHSPSDNATHMPVGSKSTAAQTRG